MGQLITVTGQWLLFYSLISVKWSSKLKLFMFTFFNCCKCPAGTAALAQTNLVQTFIKNVVFQELSLNNISFSKGCRSLTCFASSASARHPGELADYYTGPIMWSLKLAFRDLQYKGLRSVGPSWEKFENPGLNFRQSFLKMFSSRAHIPETPLFYYAVSPIPPPHNYSVVLTV